MNKRIIIVGAFNEIIELAEENGFIINGMIDNKKKNCYMNHKIIGNDKDAEKISKVLKNSFLLITPDKPDVREKIFFHYTSFGCKFASLFSKDAHISKNSIVGQGTIIQKGVNISSECNIGMFVKLNTYVNVMHNSRVGDFTTVAPNAVILGNVKIGNRCYIGANATVLPNIEICDDAIIGAGAVVTKDITSPSTFVGIPAKLLKNE